MNLKDTIESDLNIFFNTDELAEPHNIDGRVLKVVVDNDRLQYRSKNEFDGVYTGDLLYYVSAKDYGQPPKPNTTQEFDNQIYSIFDVRNDTGTYEIILQKNSGV